MPIIGQYTYLWRCNRCWVVFAAPDDSKTPPCTPCTVCSVGQPAHKWGKLEYLGFVSAQLSPSPGGQT